MVQQMFNMMIAVMAVKFILNDMPHMAGIFGLKITGAVGHPYYTAVDKQLTEAILRWGLPSSGPLLSYAGPGEQRSLEIYYGIDSGIIVATTWQGARDLAQLVQDTFPEDVTPPSFSVLRLNLPEGWPLGPAPVEGVFITQLEIPAKYIEKVGEVTL